MRYELLEHTADAMVRCYGKDLEECFGNAAYAMYDQMLDASSVRPSVAFTVTASGEESRERLFAFLSELIYITDVRGLVFSEFDVSFKGDDVICTARGESLDIARHSPRAEVKAVTYHMMAVDEKEPSVTVVFDL
jgi:SHS2 domain-containing protein